MPFSNDCVDLKPQRSEDQRHNFFKEKNMPASVDCVGLQSTVLFLKKVMPRTGFEPATSTLEG